MIHTVKVTLPGSETVVKLQYSHRFK